MAAPIGQHGKYLFWLQLLNCLFEFHGIFTNGHENGPEKWPQKMVLTKGIGTTVPL